MKKLVLLLALLPTVLCCARNRPGYQKYKVSDDIELLRISDNVYIHVSVAEIDGFGSVSSNGLIIIGRDGAACMVDTPYEEQQTEVLYNWIRDFLGARVKYFIPTHWHKDCMGGIGFLHDMGVGSYANKMTVDIARENGLVQPRHGFEVSYEMDKDGIVLECYYPGPGHSLDNIVVWLPGNKILFGGCLVKDMNAMDVGNIADGDIGEWSGSLANVQERYPDAQIIIPGHGESWGTELIGHTRHICLDYLETAR